MAHHHRGFFCNRFPISKSKHDMLSDVEIAHELSGLEPI